MEVYIGTFTEVGCNEDKWDWICEPLILDLTDKEIEQLRETDVEFVVNTEETKHIMNDMYSFNWWFDYEREEKINDFLELILNLFTNKL